MHDRMNGRMRPMDAILAELEATPEGQAWVKRNEEALHPPEFITLADLEPVPTTGDPNELIANRFLCRGGAGLLVGPTGVGKSSLSMQLAICWAIGLPCLGLVPRGALRVLIIQAENDGMDMAEMREGVVAGLNLTREEAAKALQNVFLCSESSKTGEAFAEHLDRICEAIKPDIVIVDPLLAYLGGEVSKQADVSRFLRNLINPIIQKHGVGLIFAHHVNKPPADAESKPGWNAGDFAYAGSGSAELANWARCVLVLKSIGSDTVFEFRAGKRGRRLSWKDELGKPTTRLHIAHDKTPGRICWRLADLEEVKACLPQGKEAAASEVLDLIREGVNTKTALAKKLAESGVSRATAFRAIAEAIGAGTVRVQGDGYRATLVVTGKGDNHA